MDRPVNGPNFSEQLPRHELSLAVQNRSGLIRIERSVELVVDSCGRMLSASVDGAGSILEPQVRWQRRIRTRRGGLRQDIVPRHYSTLT
jgi:hypothetical protein